MFKVMITAAAALTAVATASGEPSPAERLETLFDSPPQMRGANAWWHWQGANVTKSGITRDLQSMRDAGLSGATIFNIQDVGWDCEERMSTPLCPGLEYMNDKWWDMVSFAVADAKRLGLHNCPGYSTSGGPWITPEPRRTYGASRFLRIAIATASERFAAPIFAKSAAMCSLTT